MEDGEIVEGVIMEDACSPLDVKSEKSSFEVLREIRASIEQIVSHILSIKRKKGARSQLRELITQTFLHFVTLRQVNRSILLEEDQVKSEMEQAKAPLDLTTLQLHNLLYEKNHYVKAIKACKDFKSKYPDIELVPEEEFFHCAPEHFRGPILSNSSSHNLMLKRLNYELYQRKELCVHHEKLEQHKRSLVEAIANRKKFLLSLPSHLKSLKKASLPIQTQLGVTHTKKLKQRHSAELLPPSLYILYSQLLAQKEAFGENIDVEIEGSLKAAQAFSSQQAIKDADASIDTEASRMEDDAREEEDDGQTRRKRAKKLPSKEKLGHAGVYQAHPLTVILHVSDDKDANTEEESTLLMTLKFEYFLKLNIVCVAIEGPDDGLNAGILCNLFPNDTGRELPHQSAKLLAGDALTFDESAKSRPYKWAQHLAGIDFLPELAPLLRAAESSANQSAANQSAANPILSGLPRYRQQKRVRTVLGRLRARKLAQLALVELLDCLTKLRWPDVKCDGIPWGMGSPLCDIRSFSFAGPRPSEVSVPVIDSNHAREARRGDDVDEPCGAWREEMENSAEDGELPTLNSAATVGNDVNHAPRASNLERFKQLTFISKSMSAASVVKSHSAKKHDREPDILVDADSDRDELALLESEEDVAAHRHHPNEILEDSWVDHGAKDYVLVLTRNSSADGVPISLEAKIKISMEYPLRPPLFSLHLFPAGENHDDCLDSEWFSQLRAIESEVNLHIIKMIPSPQENNVLGHQVVCLGILFDLFMGDTFLGEVAGASMAAAGLHPIPDQLFSRSFRGRDCRKMMYWKIT